MAPIKTVREKIHKSFYRYFNHENSYKIIYYECAEDDCENNNNNIDGEKNIPQEDADLMNASVELCDEKPAEASVVSTHNEPGLGDQTTDESKENHNEQIQHSFLVVTDAEKPTTNLPTETSSGYDKLSEELSAYITLYDKPKEDSSGISDKEIELIVGGHQSHLDVETTESSSKEPLIIVVNDSAAWEEKHDTALTRFDNSPEVTGLIHANQDSPGAVHMNLSDVDCMYDVFYDPDNPFVFHIRQSQSHNPAEPSIIGNNFNRSVYDPQEVKPCFVRLIDFLKKKRKTNPFSDMVFYRRSIDRSIKSSTSGKSVKSQSRSTINEKSDASQTSVPSNPIRTTDAAIRSGNVELPAPLTESRKKRMKKLKKHKATANPIRKTNNKEKRPTEEPVKGVDNLANAAPGTEIPIEVKNMSINEWLEGSSQVEPETVDVAELIQGLSLPVFSDIEDEAFKLSAYLDSISREANVNSTPSLTRQPQPLNDDLPIVQDQRIDFPGPIDLTIEQTTPMSTDTGFCNDNGFSPYQSSPQQTVQTNGYNYILGTPDWIKNRKTEEEANHNNQDIVQVYDDKYGENESKTEDALDLTKRTENIQPSTSLDSSSSIPQIAKRKMSTSPSSEEKRRRVTQPIQKFDFRDDSSTDLDYEPSEDGNDESCNDDQVSSAFEDKKDTIEPRETAVTVTTMTPLTIKIQNNSGNSRVVIGESITNTVFLPAAIPNSSTPTTRPTMSSRNAHNILPLSHPATSQTILLLKRQITYLFGGPCYNYLNGRNCELGCKWNHHLPKKDEVFHRLLLFPSETVLGMYTYFILKNKLSFITYFRTICAVFGKKKMVYPLLDAVRHCELWKRISFYLDIYDGLLLADMPQVDALTKIVERSCKNSVAYTAIVSIIIDKDPLLFIEMLKKFYTRASIQTNHMNKMLKHVTDNPAPSLLKMFISLLDKYSITDVCDVGTYKILFCKAKRLAKGDKNLNQILKYIDDRTKGK